MSNAQTSRNSAPEEHDVYSLIRSFQLRSGGARCVLLATVYIPLPRERDPFRPRGYKHVAPPEQEPSTTKHDFSKTTSTAEFAPVGTAALVPVGSAPELSHKRTGPQRSCPACD